MICSDEKIVLMQGDCLDRMGEIADGSVDMILADLPYGTTACKWDTVIPFEPLWKHYKRIIKRNGAIVLTASQPFTSALVMSNPKWFRYCWVWDKVNRVTGFLDAARKPLKCHEDVCVFYASQPKYRPQMAAGEPYRSVRSRADGTPKIYGQFVDTVGVNGGTRHPRSIVTVKAKVNREQGLHPTQKPVPLMEYLIRTYTNEGETVLDNTMGSGTTGVACVNTGRRFIGIEKEAEYVEIARRRIAAVKDDMFTEATA